MNPISTGNWLWRAVRGRSLTFAVLFAGGLFGFSLLGSLRHFLHRLGAPWYVWLLVPFAVIALLARKEADWMPDPAKRQRWSRWILGGAIVLALLLAKFAARSPE
jgi:hypothetical protein